jgi:hypothetical protein
MSNIKFVSHKNYPEDPYVSEVVYLCIDEKHRVAYARKNGKNGGKFWGVATLGIMDNGAKTYLKSYMQDSNFLDKDIENFLEAREWESKSPKAITPPHVNAVREDFGEIPF